MPEGLEWEDLEVRKRKTNEREDERALTRLLFRLPLSLPFPLPPLEAGPEGRRGRRSKMRSSQPMVGRNLDLLLSSSTSKGVLVW
jgi:hypothetical protein